MPDYSNGKIYRIICNNTGNMYIGSTCCTLSRRLAQHKTEYNKGRKRASYDIIKEGNYQIVLIENVPCNNKEELLRKERYYIENMNCVNKKVPLRTKNEYYEDNKQYFLELNKKYQETNKNKITELNKQYRENNKDKISVLNKQYRENNKDKISEQRKKPFQCPCGSVVRKSSKALHIKSKKHLAYLESLKEEI